MRRDEVAFCLRPGWRGLLRAGCFDGGTLTLANLFDVVIERVRGGAGRHDGGNGDDGAGQGKAVAWSVNGRRIADCHVVGRIDVLWTVRLAGYRRIGLLTHRWGSRMFTAPAQLLDKIRLGEDSLLELKEVRFHRGKLKGPSQDDLADEMAAFANSVGGTLVLGVADGNREVKGIPLDRLDEVEQVLRQACEQSIKPALAPLIERLRLPDAAGIEQPVIRAEVSRSLFVHQSPGGYLHRVGSSRREMAPDYLARLFQQRSQSRLILFDETPVARAELRELDEALCRRFAPDQEEEAPEVLLHKLGMAARDEEGVWRPSVAGLLMGSRQAQRHLPGAFIQAVAYRGTEMVLDAARLYQLDALDLNGPLDEQIMGAWRFVQRNMRVGAYKHPHGGRVDVPQFDLVAVFEALVNAVVHRDYSMPGSKVRLRMFEDRLELYSPGMLPNTMTPASMPYRQAARNEVLSSLLARCPVQDESGTLRHRRRMMDKRGEGVPLILSLTQALTGRLPQYQIHDDSEVVLTIPAANEVPPDEMA